MISPELTGASGAGSIVNVTAVLVKEVHPVVASTASA